jgi:hypothetical protein
MREDDSPEGGYRTMRSDPVNLVLLAYSDFRRRRRSYAGVSKPCTHMNRESDPNTYPTYKFLATRYNIETRFPSVAAPQSEME